MLKRCAWKHDPVSKIINRTYLGSRQVCPTS
jgi:hypothetical protein